MSSIFTRVVSCLQKCRHLNPIQIGSDVRHSFFIFLFFFDLLTLTENLIDSLSLSCVLFHHWLNILY